MRPALLRNALLFAMSARARRRTSIALAPLGDSGVATDGSTKRHRIARVRRVRRFSSGDARALGPR